MISYEPNSNLGTTPVSGPADQNGQWKGVIGNVFSGDYHFSAGVYNARHARAPVVAYYG